MHQAYKPSGPSGWGRRAMAGAVWLLILGFIGHWVYEYDVCKTASTDAHPQIGCLVMSLLSTYFTWLIAAIAGFLKVVTAFL
jgi:hypothetical protein